MTIDPAHEFELRLSYLNSQFDRLLSRFHYFLTVEVALFGFLGWAAFEKGTRNGVLLAGGLGVAVSLLWYVVAAGDRQLVREYRRQVQVAAREVGGRFAETWPGQPVATSWSGPLSWYWRRLSVTRIPAYLAVATLLAWVLALGWAWLGCWVLPSCGLS